MLKSNYTILFVFLGVSLVFFSSCNIVKHVNDGEHLLKKNSIKVNKKKNLDNDVSSYVAQRPNSKVLGIYASLGLYNWGKVDFIESYDVWKDSFPKLEHSFSKMFSEKQSRGYRNFKSGINKWYFENGEADASDNTICYAITSIATGSVKIRKYLQCAAGSQADCWLE